MLRPCGPFRDDGVLGNARHYYPLFFGVWRPLGLFLAAKLTNRPSSTAKKRGH
jgi:hypothetical protein